MILEVDDVSAGYGPITVLRGISMAVAPGEILGVLGRNGMGKSTLIRCLSGLIRPDRRPHRLRRPRGHRDAGP